MSEPFDSVEAGLEPAMSHGRGQPSNVVVHQISAVDGKAVRRHVRMTQREFAASHSASASERSATANALGENCTARHGACGTYLPEERRRT